MKTILVADDDEDNLTITSTILEYSGYAVLQARDGAEALDMAREHAPDLILLDVSLPRVNGWSICTELKNDPAMANIIVVMLTAHALQEDHVRARQVGSDGFLTKPIEPRKIVAEVSLFIGTPQ
jgi:CheY-like chemotaxis protein